MTALVDAGPIVALVDDLDPAHADCVKALGRIMGPLRTTWPVITEALHLIDHHARAGAIVFDMISTGGLQIAELTAMDAPRMQELMRKYADQPMDLADASLVVIAERERLTQILTLDRRDFAVYRPGRTGHFEILS